MDDEKFPIVKGYSVIVEARKLAQDASFSEIEGVYLPGDEVTLVVDPRYNEDCRTFRVLVTFLPRFGQDVDWAGVEVQAVRSEGLTESVPINQRGSALFASLDPGHYTLALEEVIRRAESPETPVADLTGVAPAAIIKSAYDLLREIAASPVTPRKESEDALKDLVALAEQPGPPARPVLVGCLDVMCERSLSLGLRISAAKPFTADTVKMLADLDLTPYAAKLTHPSDMRSENLSGGLETALCQAFGAILSAGKEPHPGETALLDAFIFRTKSLSQCVPRAVRGAVRTRGSQRPIRVRGSVRTRGAGHPLAVLAAAGGSRVREALKVRLGVAGEGGNKALAALLDAIDLEA